MEATRVRAWAMVISGVLPSMTLYLMPPDRVKRVQDDGVALDQDVEEMPHGGERLVLGGIRDLEGTDETPGDSGRNLGEFQLLAVTPFEKPPDGSGVGAPGLPVGDPRREKLVGGKTSRRSGPLENGGKLGCV